MRISDWSSDVCSSDLIASIANAIILSLAEPFAIEGVQVRIGSSVGIAVADGAAVSAAALVRNADLAPYAAQDPGRDRKSAASGNTVSVRVDLGGRRVIKTKKIRDHHKNYKKIA